jgi:L-lactate permease
VISSIVAAVVVFSLGVIAVKWFVPQENSTSIQRNDKNTNSKPVQKLKP